MPDGDKNLLMGLSRDGEDTTVTPLGYPGRVLGPGETYDTVSEKISSIVLKQPLPKSWWFGFTVAFAMLMMFLMAVSWLF